MFRKLLIAVSVSLFLTMAVCAQDMVATTSTTKSTSDKTSKGPVFRPTKDQIKQVQTMLKDKKLYTGEASGSYNDDTRTGIKSFQKDNGLKETGTLNRATLEKFGVTLTDTQKAIPVSPGSFASATKDTGSSKSTTTSTSTKATTSGDSPKKPAPFRANGGQIKAAQKILKDGKMYVGETTGTLDDPTRDGLKKYQGANTLNVTGTLNAATLDKMGIALTDAQKANVATQTAYDGAKKN